MRRATKSRPGPCRAFVAALLLLAGLGPAALAADHSNLEDNLPTHLDDAVPTPFRNRELQAYFRWEREVDENVFELVPRLEAGVWLNTQVELELPYRWGSGATDDEFGDLKLGFLYNVNQETIAVPMVSLKAAAEFPTGEGSAGVDPSVVLLLSKTLPYTSRFVRLHANGTWKRNAASKRRERDDLFKAAFGKSVRCGADTVLIFDYAFEQEEKKGKEAHLLEAGVRRQLTPFTLVAAGASAGLTRESPDFQATLGFQHSF